MEAAVFNTRVVNTLNSLNSSERTALTGALASEFFLGRDISSQLEPLQQVMYVIVRTYAEQALRRMRPRVVDLKAL